MQSILLEIPEEIASQIKLPPKRAKMMLMEELVLRLYDQGIITSAHGASLLKKGSIRNSQQVKRPKSLIVFLFIIFSRACCEAKGEALRYSMHGNENVRNCILIH